MLAAGARLGPYEIKSSIAAGGMGEVYRAVDTRLDRAVAVKILPSDFNAQLRTRFEREARLISSLTHPNICTLHDVGESNGTHYLVMELIDGETLTDRLTRGPLPLHDLLSVGTQVAAALQKAHRHGVVHRDLKPGNIMLTKHGVKLLDFGLAKTVAPLGNVSHADATEHKPLTAEGTIVGTFQYMAPEQLEGLDADPRTDIFALGAVLYEMATGKRAFEGKTRTSLIAAIVQGQPAPIHQLQPLTPPALERLIEACLAKDPEDRMQSAHDVMLQLRWIAESGGERRSPARSSRALIVPVAIAAVLAGAAIAWFMPRNEKKRAYSFTVPGATAQYRDVGAVMIAPDGMKVAFIARDIKDRKQFVWVQSLDSASLRRLDASEWTQLLCWSPDSRSVIVYRGRAVIKVPADGSAPQTLGQVDVSQADINADGDLLVAQGDNALTRVNTNTNERSQLTTLNAKEGEIAHTGPRFLPDGRHFLYVARTRSTTSTPTRNFRAYVSSLDNREAKFLGELTSTPVYADPGYLLYVRETVLEARPFDAKKLQFTGSALTVLANVAQTGPFSLGDRAGITLSTDSTPAAERSGKSASRTTSPEFGWLPTGSASQSLSPTRRRDPSTSGRLAFINLRASGSSCIPRVTGVRSGAWTARVCTSRRIATACPTSTSFRRTVRARPGS